MRIGIIGAGGMGNVHARQYRKMPKIELSVFDAEVDRMAAFSDKWDADPIASQPDLIEWADVVDICLPTSVHFASASAAIAAGRPCFIEKPVTRSWTEAVSLLEQAGRAGIKVGVGQVVRFFPEFARGHDLVAQGLVGTPAAVRTRRGGGMPKGSQDWFGNHSESGGVLLDLTIHDFDWLRWTIGEVDEVFSRSVGVTTGGGPDYALTLLKFKNGCVGHVESTWMDPGGFRTAYEVAGSGGLIEFDSRATPSLTVATRESTSRESNQSPLDDPYYRELVEFLGWVRGELSRAVNLEEGVKSLGVALAAMESAHSGKAVKPPSL